MEFKSWPKIPRIGNEKQIFTEKIDGTNACIVISQEEGDKNTIASVFFNNGTYNIWAQSRTKFITPNDDNFGFAKWVESNAGELVKLGEGYHYGEWWGLGIQRGYNLDKKVFSLFNTYKWGPHNPNTPACVNVVPVLPVTSEEEAIQFLKTNGSMAAPGYMRPEGSVVFKILSGVYYKIIIDK